jgi:phospholipase/carboxylesterase
MSEGPDLNAAMVGSLMGRLSFTHREPDPTAIAFEPGRHRLGLFPERDALLFVPTTLPADGPVRLMVMFHGANGFPEKVAPFLEAHAEREGFLLLLPHSMFPTWDIVIAGNGPDLQRLGQALAAVASRYRLDPAHLAFAGFSDGASYALSIGLTNGRLVTHVIAFSGGFMSVLLPEGAPNVFIAHGTRDEQCPIDSAGRAHAQRLRGSGYPLRYVEFDGPHAIQPEIVAQAVDFFVRDGSTT